MPESRLHPSGCVYRGFSCLDATSSGGQKVIFSADAILQTWTCQPSTSVLRLALESSKDVK